MVPTLLTAQPLSELSYRLAEARTVLLQQRFPSLQLGQHMWELRIRPLNVSTAPEWQLEGRLQGHPFSLLASRQTFGHLLAAAVPEGGPVWLDAVPDFIMTAIVRRVGELLFTSWGPEVVQAVESLEAQPLQRVEGLRTAVDSVTLTLEHPHYPPINAILRLSEGAMQAFAALGTPEAATPLNQDFPIRTRWEIGYASLPLSAAQILQPGDILLLSEAEAEAEINLFFLRIGESGGLRLERDETGDLMVNSEYQPKTPAPKAAITAEVPIEIIAHYPEKFHPIGLLHQLVPGQAVEPPDTRSVCLSVGNVLLGEGRWQTYQQRVGIQITHLRRP